MASPESDSALTQLIGSTTLATKHSMIWYIYSKEMKTTVSPSSAEFFKLY